MEKITFNNEQLEFLKFIVQLKQLLMLQSMTTI